MMTNKLMIAFTITMMLGVVAGMIDKDTDPFINVGAVLLVVLFGSILIDLIKFIIK